MTNWRPYRSEAHLPANIYIVESSEESNNSDNSEKKKRENKRNTFQPHVFPRNSDQHLKMVGACGTYIYVCVYSHDDSWAVPPMHSRLPFEKNFLGTFQKKDGQKKKTHLYLLLGPLRPVVRLVNPSMAVSSRGPSDRWRKIRWKSGWKRRWKPPSEASRGTGRPAGGVAAAAGSSLGVRWPDRGPLNSDKRTVERGPSSEDSCARTVERWPLNETRGEAWGGGGGKSDVETHVNKLKTNQITFAQVGRTGERSR